MSSKPTVSSRAAAIPPFHVMDLLARAKAREAAGHDVIHMEVGEPDFPTPAPIVAAAQAALETGRQSYTPAIGLPVLRDAISVDVSRGRKRVAAENVAVTSGASAALQLALTAILSVGDEVLLPDPGYPCNAVMVSACGAKPVTLSTNAEDDFQPTADSVSQAWASNTRAIVLASPSNPTGTLIKRAELLAICAVAAERGGWVVFDEIYSRLVEGEVEPSPFGSAGNLICINSFSKYHGMTGWRLGWLLAPAEVMPVIERLAQNLMLAPPTLAQQAAMAAFDVSTTAICEQRRFEFNQRRGLMVNELLQLGFEVPARPVGAFYAWARLPEVMGDSFELCHRLLNEKGVVVTPGCDFSTVEASRYIRLAATNKNGRFLEGIGRIAELLASS